MGTWYTEKIDLEYFLLSLSLSASSPESTIIYSDYEWVSEWVRTACVCVFFSLSFPSSVPVSVYLFISFSQHFTYKAADTLRSLLFSFKWSGESLFKIKTIGIWNTASQNYDGFSVYIKNERVLFHFHADLIKCPNNENIRN